MHERLIEDWLDSASERSYQAPFCQMLAAKDLRVLHSTRHSPIEMGKDVIAVDREGNPFAYQLKGNPAGRLTLHQFREIEPQLKHLTNLAVQQPTCSGKQHRSFLVTNGYIDEEVLAAIELRNQAEVNAGYPHRKIEVLQRGDLVAMAQELGPELWPTEIQPALSLLQMLVEPGTGFFHHERANGMLAELLGLSSGPKPTWSAAEVKRRVTSAALLISLSLKNYEFKQNHIAIVGAWVQFAAAVIAACERHGVSFRRNGASSVDIAMMRIKDALIDLAIEALERPVLTQDDAMTGAVFYKARYTLVLGLVSLLWFWCEEDGWPAHLARDDLETFLRNGTAQTYLWGEGAIPQILLYYWFMRRRVAGGRPDALLFQMIQAVAAREASGEPRGLPSPYWTFEDVVRHQLAGFLGSEDDPMRDETSGINSYFAEPLLQLLVRTNLKNHCKQLWPNLSRLIFVEFAPDESWQFCLTRCERGEYVERHPPQRKEWSQLIKEARSIRCDSAPPTLVDHPLLLALFTICFPYRCRPDVLRRLSFAFNRAWLLDDGPIE